MRREFLLVAGALALLGLAVAWFLANFDRVHSREWTGMTGAARRNPFLAAERLAERLDVPARELRSASELDELPPRGTLLLLPARREALHERDRARVLGWVARGGHLLVEAEWRGTPDPILDALSVSRSASGKHARPGISAAQAYRWPGTEPMKVTLHPEPALARPGAEALGLEGYDAVLRFAQGDGHVTAVSSLGFARNGAIGSYDNAAFFWALARREANLQSLVVFNRLQPLSLASLLVQQAWPALFALALLVALWLWRVAPRFGPIAAEPASARRQLLDHLRASGRFAWSAGCGPQLAAAAREAALRDFVRRHPAFATLDMRARTAELALATRLEPADLDLLLHAEQVRTPADFMRTIALAQQVHERLAAPRR